MLKVWNDQFAHLLDLYRTRLLILESSLQRAAGKSGRRKGPAFSRLQAIAALRTELDRLLALRALRGGGAGIRIDLGLPPLERLSADECVVVQGALRKRLTLTQSLLEVVRLTQRWSMDLAQGRMVRWLGSTIRLSRLREKLSEVEKALRESHAQEQAADHHIREVAQRAGVAGGLGAGKTDALAVLLDEATAAGARVAQYHQDITAALERMDGLERTLAKHRGEMANTIPDLGLPSVLSSLTHQTPAWKRMDELKDFDSEIALAKSIIDGSSPSQEENTP